MRESHQSVCLLDSFEMTLAHERPRLVALCAHITGDAHAAEDLAQETLLEAWRRQETLRDPERIAAWLAGIARNLCLRWRRAQGRERSHRVEPHASDAIGASVAAYQAGYPADAYTDTLDLEEALERKELIELLDRALALLPADTRAILVARYAYGQQMSEIAARKGSAEATTAMRAHRGKQALRRTLTTTLRQEIAPYLVNGDDSLDWQETRLWCFACGLRRLRGRVNEAGDLLLTCSVCFPSERDALFKTCPEIWGRVKSYGRAFERTLDWMNSYYQRALDEQASACYICGEALPAPRPTLLPAWRATQAHGFWSRCSGCGAESAQPLAGLALATPEGRQFRQEHPRMRLAPERDIEVDGQSVVVTRFISMTDLATLDVLFVRDSGRPLPMSRALSR